MYRKKQNGVQLFVRAYPIKKWLAHLGINIHLVFTLVFVFGSLLAGLGGVLGAPILGTYPGMEFSILILSLVVLVVGGLGFSDRNLYG